MAKINMKYFNGTQELHSIHGVPNEKFLAAGGVKSIGNYFDSFKRLMGLTDEGILLPVERAIKYKATPSLHECDSRCMGGKPNGACECRCGGKNHGIGFGCR